MAIIDTLRLARALHDRGGFSQEAADATAEALNAALGEDVATKADIDGVKSAIGQLEVATKADIDGVKSAIGQLEAVTKVDIARLDGKITVMMWAVGINAAATITMLVKLWPAQ